MSDKEKRDAAVDAFAEAMKARLDEKAEIGYHGWDSWMAPERLREDLLRDAVDMEIANFDGNAVDIANRAMMLWYRRNQPAPAGEGEA